MSSSTTRVSARIAHRTTTAPITPSPLRIVQNATPISKNRDTTPIKSTQAKGTPRKATPRKVSPRKISPVKAELILEQLETVRKCVGCKTEHDIHLFLALNPKSEHDYKEKCFKCRRVDAIGDFLKSHSKNTNGTVKLTVAHQQDHIESQKEACQKWKRIMANRGVQIHDNVVESVMEAVTKHPALIHAVKTSTKKQSNTSYAPIESTSVSKTNKTTMNSTAHAPASIGQSSIANDDSPLTSTIDSLQRAVDNLKTARNLPTGHLDKVMNSVFQREFKFRTITALADMLTEAVELAVATKDQYQEIEQSELEAIRALANMKYGFM